MYVHDVFVIRGRDNAIPLQASVVVCSCIEGEDAWSPRVSRHLARHALVAVTAPGLVVHEVEHLLQVRFDKAVRIFKIINSILRWRPLLWSLCPKGQSLLTMKSGHLSTSCLHQEKE